MDWWKKKKEKKKRALLCKETGAILLEDLIECCDGKSNPFKYFSADLILKATNNFSESNRISGIRSFYWDWYSGINDNYRMILIKNCVLERYEYNKDICRDIVISSMVSGHKNFMKLAGCCLEFEYPLLIYYGEKKQYSSIDFEKIVSWKKRMKIAEDIATALAYLHTAFSTPFVYRLMSVENILIDEDGVAKLIDFSHCISIPLGKTYVFANPVQGTYAYMSDTYIMRTGVVSEETDTYSFGIFMQLLRTGGKIRLAKLAKEYYAESNWVNTTWVSIFIEHGGLVDEIADPKMLENMDVTEATCCGMDAFLLLSLRCVSLENKVPTMVAVAKELKNIRRSSQNASSSA